MDWITGIQQAIDYIEDNLTETIDYEEVAKRCYSSSYHFQRVFSILCGYTLGEYIRNRRLTLAGRELATTNAKVIDVAMKYGYESPDSFAKAFQKFHGILPSQARNNGSNLKSFSRLVLKFSLEGGTTMNYRIVDKESLVLLGHGIKCSGSPTNADNTYEETKRHWQKSKDIIRKLKTFRNDAPVWYDVYTDFVNDEFTHIIAVDCSASHTEKDLINISIPAHKYAVFETSCCESPDDEWVLLMKKIVAEWLPTTQYKISEHPQINRLFFNDDYSERYMEIWIPIEEK
ncbi:MAG: AraC family transcriptional regulator [Clostridia bacterium]|nr:AraC family transcriptional regulator [Clostridia bacterium]